MKELIAEEVAKVVLAADLSKLGRRSFVQFASLGEIDLFITNETLDADSCEEIESVGVAIVDGVTR